MRQSDTAGAPPHMKCQKCNKAATMHITDVIADEQFEEHHLCEDCAQKFLYEPPKKGSAKSAEGEESDEIGTLNQRQCPHCGIKFVEFRNSGRLGCPHDYDEFRDELLPLLENIHGETRHVGKTPRRLPQSRQAQTEMITLRKQLQQAVTREDYEEAAQLRDQIRRLEEG
jgi:protein arginine kinase activator